MANVTRFEDLDVWKTSINLTTIIYSTFSACRDFGFKDQIQRAAVSIPSNIAEGFERQSNKEFIQFLYIAKGSAGELRTQLMVAKNLNFISNEIFEVLYAKVEAISKMLFALIKYRKSLVP